MTATNTLRANRIFSTTETVPAYVDFKDDPQTLAASIIADLHHFCDANNLDFASIIQQGETYYQDELIDPEI